jgi:riboflavin kinase/FMN adenylyltransferase
MSVYYSLDNFPTHLRGGVFTIGNFDGVHRGHRALLDTIRAIKHERLAGVLSFSPHFIELLQPEKKLFRLSSDAYKTQLLLKYGADFVVIQKLSKEFLALSATNFVSKVLEAQLGISELVIGDDFRFGKNAEGNLEHLKKGAFKLHIIKTHNESDERCSSSAIRKYLSAGNIIAAQKMLGRYFSIRGPVRAGQGIAKGLGFATANIIPESGCALARGVYATVTRINNKNYLSATNVGVRPSVSAQPVLTIETHCLDQKLDCVGLELEIFFLKYVREEIKFSSLEALKIQVQKDIAHIRELITEDFLEKFSSLDRAS